MVALGVCLLGIILVSFRFLKLRLCTAQLRCELRHERAHKQLGRLVRLRTTKQGMQPCRCFKPTIDVMELLPCHVS
jgi:hypothetical protein